VINYRGVLQIVFVVHHLQLVVISQCICTQTT
jgi:hypothetical protein